MTQRLDSSINNAAAGNGVASCGPIKSTRITTASLYDLIRRQRGAA